MSSRSTYTLGIDIGSSTTKCVILKDGTELLASAVVNVGAGTKGPQRALEEALGKAGLAMDDMAFVVATGYGRNTFERADKQLSELSCHAKGAFRFFPGARTVIDIGGQDAKVIRVGESGQIANFVMNDKCAAGTGRFLDAMSRVLDVDIKDLEQLGEQSTAKAEISSTCTVFAESEVISQLSNNVAICDIVAGIHYSVAAKVSGLARRLGVVEDVVMTGGVAQNRGVVKAMEDLLGVAIKTSPQAQIAGALGAAIFAYENLPR